MMHGQGGNIERLAERFSKTGPHQQRTGQPRARRVGNRINILTRASASRQHMREQWNQPTDMVARG